MGGNRPTRFRNQRRHRQIIVAANAADRVDHIVRVFAHRIVHGRRTRRARAVVVDAKSATDVDVGDVESHLPQLDVVAADFFQAGLDEPDVGHLAAEMKVHQLEQVRLPGGLQLVEQADELNGRQAELRFFAATLGPAPRSFGRQLDPYADRRGDSHFGGDLQQDIELVGLFEDNHHGVAELLADQGEAHELLVLVAVADDQPAAALIQAQYRHQLGLRPALEPHAVGCAEFHDLLHHMTLLVHLNRIYCGVGSFVPEFLDRRREPIRQLGDARLQNVGETQQQRQPDALGAEVHCNVVEVDVAPGRAIRMHRDMTFVVDAEISETPALHVVQLLGILDRPARRLDGRRSSGNDWYGGCGHLLFSGMGY